MKGDQRSWVVIEITNGINQKRLFGAELDRIRITGGADSFDGKVVAFKA